jgi:hypothetical protein
MVKTLLAAGACALAMIAALPMAHAQCPTPNLNVRYSNSFYQAQKSFMKSSSDTGASLSVTLPVESGVIPIGASSIDKSTWESLQTVDTNTAVTYIQQELQNSRTAIVAECMAALCRVGQSSPGGSRSAVLKLALQTQPVVSICRHALGFAGDDIEAKQVDAVPSPVVVVFKDTETKRRTVRVHVVNLTAGTMKMRVDQADDLTPDEKLAAPVLFAGKSKVFELKPNAVTAIPFSILPPDDGAGLQSYDVDIVTEPNNSVAAHARFLVLRASDLIPKPQLACGHATANAHIKTDSDDGRTYEETHNASVSLQDGQAVVGGPAYNWINNGGAAAMAQYTMMCRQNPSTDKSASMSFSFSGTAGGKCGRNGSNKGGGGHSNPRWVANVLLPGDAKTKWSVSISARMTSRQAYMGGCRIYWESQAVDLSPNGQQVSIDVKDSAPGAYVVELSCSGADGGCVGGSEYTWLTGPDDIVVNVKAWR